MKRKLRVIILIVVLVMTIAGYNNTTYAANNFTNANPQGSIDQQKIRTYYFDLYSKNGDFLATLKTVVYGLYSQVDRTAEIVNVAYTFSGTSEDDFSVIVNNSAKDSTRLVVYYNGNFALNIYYTIASNGTISYTLQTSLKGTVIVDDKN